MEVALIFFVFLCLNIHSQGGEVKFPVFVLGSSDPSVQSFSSTSERFYLFNISLSYLLE